MTIDRCPATRWAIQSHLISLGLLNFLAKAPTFYAASVSSL